MDSFGERVTFIEAALEGIGSWPDLGRFDLVVALNVFHFISEEDLDPSIQGIFRLVKEEGLFLAKQSVQYPEALKPLIHAGVSYIHDKNSPTGAEKNRLDELWKRYREIESAGGNIGLDRVKNVYHPEARLESSFRNAGFDQVYCIWKRFSSMMLLGRRGPTESNE